MRQACSSRNRAVIRKSGNLAGFLLAGYPDRRTFLKAAAGCERRGLTVLEVGFPSEAPSLDGAVIRRAHQSADRSVCQDIAYWRELRNAVRAPIWLMGYRKDLIENGLYRTFCSESLIDGLVIPDMDLPDRRRLSREAARRDVDVLGFLTPDSDEETLARVLENDPVIYYALYAGPTGAGEGRWEDYSRVAEKVRSFSHRGVFAGFGIQAPHQAEALIRAGFAGVVIGTVLIQSIGESEQSLYALVRRFAEKL